MPLKTPPEIAKKACEIAAAKAASPLTSLAVSAFLAGAYIAIGGSTMVFVTQDLPNYVGLGLSKYIGGIIFSSGLFMIVVAGGELFTGNSLITMGVLTGQVSIRDLIKNWVAVYIFNFAGAASVALLAHAGGVMAGIPEGAVVAVSAQKVSLTALQMFTRGILCNWLVAAAVWMSFGADDVSGKFLCSLIPVAAFTALGYEHSVANMYFFSHALLTGNAAQMGITAASCGVNLAFVTAGNIIGGAFFVAGLYYLAYRKIL